MQKILKITVNAILSANLCVRKVFSTVRHPVVPMRLLRKINVLRDGYDAKIGRIEV